MAFEETKFDNFGSRKEWAEKEGFNEEIEIDLDDGRSQVKNPFQSSEGQHREYGSSGEIPGDVREEEYNVSIVRQFLGTVTTLVVVSCMFISEQLSTRTAAGVDTKAVLVVVMFLASTLCVILKALVEWNVIGVPKGGVGVERGWTSLAGWVAVAMGYLACHFLTVSRTSVVFLNLYISPFNPGTAVAFLLDIFGCEGAQWKVLVGYGLALSSFAILNKLIAPSSIGQTISKLDYRFFNAMLVFSGILMVFWGGLINYMMVLVNVCLSVVFLMSLQDCYFNVKFFPSFAIACISIVLEYVVLSNGLSVLSFSNLLLPVFVKTKRKATINSSIYNEPPRETQSSRSILRELLSHKDTRAIFNFLLLNTTFMFIQLLYSFRSRSLGLLSDSLHMALDCVSLALGLFASILSKNEIDQNGRFPFGLKNFEVLAGFTNGTLLIGISGSIIFEAIGRLLNPVALQKTNELITVSILGLLVNLVGIFAFNHGHEHGHSHGHSHSHASSHSHENSHSHSHGTVHHDESENCEDANSSQMSDNMKGIFLHILADTLGSVGVVISTLLTKFFSWEGFDPLASITIAVLIFFSAVPLIKSTSSALLLKLTDKNEKGIRAAFNELANVKGIKSFTTPRFWPSSDSSLCGYIHIQVYRGENIPFIKKKCQQLFAQEKIDAMIQMEYDYDVCWCRTESDIVSQ